MKSAVEQVLARLESRLVRIEQHQHTIIDLLKLETRMELKMAHNLDEVLAKLEEQSSIEDGILALLEDTRAQVKSAGGDQAKIDAVFDKLTANTAKLSEKMVANTEPSTSAPEGEE